jgi:hypothetical protein
MRNASHRRGSRYHGGLSEFAGDLARDETHGAIDHRGPGQAEGHGGIGGLAAELITLAHQRATQSVTQGGTAVLAAGGANIGCGQGGDAVAAGGQAGGAGGIPAGEAIGGAPYGETPEGDA